MLSSSVSMFVNKRSTVSAPQFSRFASGSNLTLGTPDTRVAKARERT